MSDQDKSGTDLQGRDPVVHSSLSKQLFIWSALLVLSMAWGLYDEVYGTRPWKGYEARFEKLYSKYLANARLGEVTFEKQIRSSPEYQQLDREMKAAEQAALPAAAAIDKQVNQDLVPKILALNDPFQEVRSHIGALTYEIEVTGSESSKDSLRKIVAGDCELISGLVARRQELSQQREDSRVQEVVADGPGEDKSNPSTELFRKIRAQDAR